MVGATWSFSALLFLLCSFDRTEVGGEEKWAGVGFDQKKKVGQSGGFRPR